jgi:diguanylate cyclase (GGDEF)-like protein
MTKKTHSPQSNSENNQLVKASANPNTQLINHLNRIINTQEKLNEPNISLNTFIKVAAQQAQNLTHATGTVIELIEDDNLVYQAATGSLDNFEGQQNDKNDGISGLCLSTHQVIRSDDVENDSRIHADEYSKLQAKSLVITPFFHENNVTGVIKVISSELNAFSDIDIQTIRVIAGLIGSAVSKQLQQEILEQANHEKTRALEDLRKMEKKIKHITHHDYLTGLPNQNSFIDQLDVILAKAKRKKQLIALMYLDIDNFKNVNDSMGHAIGDKLLHAFASRLKQCLRSSDTVARFGGDEFILLLDDIKEAQDAVVISNKILQAMRQPFNLGNKPLNITTSIGIAFLKDFDISADDFLKQADQALYISKNSGRNTFYIYDNDLTIEHSPTNLQP